MLHGLNQKATKSGDADEMNLLELSKYHVSLYMVLHCHLMSTMFSTSKKCECFFHATCI